jgi:DNA repair protein RecN (Recombination protein N)
VIKLLAQLKIRDFAIIDDVEINFLEGMTVLTGETGSGKSIIIDAINLLLGERASNEMVRFDKDKAFIEGLFYCQNKQIEQLFNQFGIPYEDELIIVREISKNGRNMCRLNGSLVTVNQLKQVGTYLVDVHVQHDTTRLINTNNYLYLIDSLKDESMDHTLELYRQDYEAYMHVMKEYQTIIKEAKANQEKLEFYKFQLEEFKQAKINLDEYQDLMNKRNLISNFDKIYENLNKANNNLKDHKVLELIFEASQHLNKLASINDVYQDLSEQLMNAYYQLDDVSNLMNDEVGSLDYNPKELDFIDTRLSVYSQLKRKYKVDIEDLIKLYQSLQQKIDQIENHDFIIDQLVNRLKGLYQKTFHSARLLREKRQAIASEIEESLVNHLKDLKLMNARFEVVFNELPKESDYLNASMFHEHGFDEVDFYVSFNKGEPTKPLSKIASGGELSRFMLGLKTILTQKQNLSTVVFDEIDTGVSGITANAIAQKIKSIGKTTQVLCISHLPQVASIADHHLYIYKTEQNDRTNTNVRLLNDDDRVQEIAKMIAGNSIDEVAILNAKNLLNGSKSTSQ